MISNTQMKNKLNISNQVLLCDSKEDAYCLSKDMCKSKNPNTIYQYAVVENIFERQFGLHIPAKDVTKVRELYDKRMIYKSPFWLKEDFINGERKLVIGFLPSSNFEIGIVDPKKERVDAQKQFPKSIIEEIRDKRNSYTQDIRNQANSFIAEFNIINKGNLKNIDPRTFESIIAELLKQKGFDIYLTQATRDGGKDIVAAIEINGKPNLMIVSCKRTKTLSLDDIRALIGVYHIHNSEKNQNISHMLFATSALMTTGKELRNIQEKTKDLTIVDGNGILQWINEYTQTENGLYIPRGLNTRDIFQMILK